MTTTPKSMMSNCCKAPVITILGDEGTNHYSCKQCGKPCDPLRKSTEIITNTSMGHPNSHPHDCICKECSPPPVKEEWEMKFLNQVCCCAWLHPDQKTHNKKDCKIYTYSMELAFIRSTRSQAYKEGYLKGYKEGSGGISGDVLTLHDQYEKGKVKGRREAIEQAKAIFAKHKDKPMTGNVVLLELDVLLDTFKGKEKV